MLNYRLRGAKLLHKWICDTMKYSEPEARKYKLLSIADTSERMGATDNDIWRTLNDIACRDIPSYFEILKYKIKSNKN